MDTFAYLLLGGIFGLIAFVVYVRVSTKIEKKRAAKKREELRRNSKRSESVKNEST